MASAWHGMQHAAARTRLCSTMWRRLKPSAACAARGARLGASCSASCNGCSAPPLPPPRRDGFWRAGACCTAAGSAASSGAGSTRARIVSGDDAPDPDAAPDAISKGRPLGVTLSASSRSSHSPLTRAVKSRPVCDQHGCGKQRQTEVRCT
eukprot:scaffold78661_cov60-Phaeocystis_antarctica.AAC.1